MMEWKDTFCPFSWIFSLQNIKLEEKIILFFLLSWKGFDPKCRRGKKCFALQNKKQVFDHKYETGKAIVWRDTSSPLWPAGQLLIERLPEISKMKLFLMFFRRCAELLVGRRPPEMKSFWTSTMIIALFGRTIWSLQVDLWIII